MTRDPHHAGSSSGPAGLFHIKSGQILGDLPRGTAERGYHLYQERRVIRIVWTGDGLESEISQPVCNVRQGFIPGKGFVTPEPEVIPPQYRGLLVHVGGQGVA